MSKKKIKAFRLLTVLMVVVVMLNNSGMTVLATGLDGINDDSEEIFIYTEGNDVVTEESEDCGENESNNENDIDVLHGGPLNLTSDRTCTSDNLYGYGEIYLNGYKLTITDDFVTNAWIKTGENGELIVNGNMTAGGIVDCSNGKLTVKGNYTQKNQYLVGFSGKATINILKNIIFIEDGFYNICGDVTVGGDFFYSSKETISSNQRDAFWTIKGNITQEEDSGQLNFGNLILAGTKGQTISLQENSFIGYLTVQNKDVTLRRPYLKQVILQTDFAPKGNIPIIAQGLFLNGHKMTTPDGLENIARIVTGENGELVVNGDLTGNGSVDCYNGKLVVNGNYTLTFGSLELGEGSTVYISQNLIFKDKGYYYPREGKGEVTVEGDFVYSSEASSEEHESVWTIKGDIVQEAEAGYIYMDSVQMPTKGSSVALPNGKIGNLFLSYGKKNYTITPDNCYDKIIATCTLTFDANGGSVTPKSKKITTEQKYGELPVPTMEGFDFEGWYTKKTGGDKITENTVVTAVDDLTVYAHWKEKPVMNFDDVHESDWFYKAVKYVFENGIMAGVNGGKSFDPHGKLTREQFTQVLYAYEGKPDVANMNGFTDVNSNAWYAKSVYWAKEKGITGGKPDGTFGVGENISRQDLAVMLYTYARVKGYDLTKNDNALNNFTDKGKVSNYAKDAMKWAVTQGIISGKGNGKVDPTGNATRAECATMVMKLIEKNK